MVSKKKKKGLMQCFPALFSVCFQLIWQQKQLQDGGWVFLVWLCGCLGAAVKGRVQVCQWDTYGHSLQNHRIIEGGKHLQAHQVQPVTDPQYCRHTVCDGWEWG